MPVLDDRGKIKGDKVIELFIYNHCIYGGFDMNNPCNHYYLCWMKSLNSGYERYYNHFISETFWNNSTIETYPNNHYTNYLKSLQIYDNKEEAQKALELKLEELGEMRKFYDRKD